MRPFLRDSFYALKPLIPRRWQLFLRRWMVCWLRSARRSVWPIDPAAGKAPAGWAGWPEGRRFALVLTHDVELQRGHDRALELMRLEQQLGVRAAFNFVPERYHVCPEVLRALDTAGFEIGVHGLKHDGKLFRSHAIFAQRAPRINHYLKQWGAVGFRAPSMQCNLNWIGALDIEYDASTFDVDPFEFQSEGVQTIFPFLVGGGAHCRDYVELPYTLIQDFTLFVLMGETDIALWKRKLDWIAQAGGMALMNTHPDYMHFGGGRPGREEYPCRLYLDLIEYAQQRYADQYWQALPREVARFWRCAGYP